MKIYGNTSLSQGAVFSNLTVDNGTTYPSNPSIGELFYHNTFGLVLYNGSTWLPTSTSLVTNTVVANIPAISGTTIITFNNSTPSSTAGSQILTATITPSNGNSKIAIIGSISVDCTVGIENLALAAFKGTTCIGVYAIEFLFAGYPQVIPFTFIDSNAGSNAGKATTYTLRFGAASACTWYVNRMRNSIFNGAQSNSVLIKEF
jgi:hypothetical protein